MSSHFLRNTLYFSSSRYVLLGLSLIRNLVVARALGPDEYGLWVIAMLVLTYGDQIHLGLRHAGDREIPYANGRTDAKDAAQLAGDLYAGILILSAAGLLAAVAIFLYLGPNEVLSRLILLCAAIVVSDQISRFHLMILRTRREFVLLSKVEVAFEVLRTILVSGLAFVFSLVGALAAFGAASIATSLYFLLRYRSEIKPRLHGATFRRLVPVGIPLLASGLLYILTISLDRVVGAVVLSKAELGILGLASLLAQIPVSAAQSIKDVLYPSLSEAFGQEVSATTAWAMYRKGLAVSAVILPVLVALVALTSAPIIHLVLPAYVESIPLVAILSNGIYFLCLAAMPLGLLMAARKTRLFLTVQATSVIVSVGLYLLLNHYVGGIVAICYAASCSFFLFASMLLTVAKEESAATESSSQFRLFFPSFYSMAIVALVTHFMRIEPRTELSVVLSQSGLRILIYAVCMIPLLAVLSRHIKVGELMRDVVKSHV